MKHKMQVADMDFVRKLAGSAAPDKDVRIIVAEDRTDTKDEARQSAISYWMLGYTWDEIEAVLEDFEYPKDIVSYALKQAQEYARAVLKDGPFSVFEDGQKVKLVNGSYGVVLDRRKDYIEMWNSTDGKLSVSASQIDKPASQKLTQAHALRMQASQMVRQSQEDDLEPEHEFKTYVKERAPAGYADITPEFEDTPQVENLEEQFLPETLTRELSRIQDLQARVNDLERERKEYQVLASDIHKEIKGVDAEKQDLAQRLYAQMTAELDLLEDQGFSVFMRTADKFVLLDRLIKQTPRLPSSSQKFAAVMDFITEKYPDIIEEVERVIATLEDENTVIEETVKDMLAIYPPRKKGSKVTAQAMGKLRQWLSSQWDRVTSWIEDWNTKYEPQLSAGLAAIDDLASEISSGQVTARVKVAMQTFGAKV